MDGLEVNHVYDAHAKPILTQYLGRHWIAGTHLISWWRMHAPVSEFKRGKLIFSDDKRIRVIHFRWWRETWTQYDVEVDERQRHPQRNRKGLTNARKRVQAVQ